MTTQTEERSRDALRAAQLYYMQDLTMDAIAHEMRVSRSSVSRLLQHARDVGLVTISISPPDDARGQMAQRIADRFGITAHVVPTPARTSEAERLERTALTAARILAERIESSMTIGIAWGSTLSAIARHVPAKDVHDTHIVQMNGAANLRTSGIPYAGEILSRLGAAWSSSVHQFPVPALFDDPRTKQAMWRERSVRSVLEIQQRVGLFVFGLGSPHAEVPSHVYSGDYSWDIPELNARSSGPDLDTVRRIPRRFCVVSSLSKLTALRGALAAGLVTELVVEEALARRLLSVTR